MSTGKTISIIELLLVVMTDPFTDVLTDDNGPARKV